MAMKDGSYFTLIGGVNKERIGANSLLLTDVVDDKTTRIMVDLGSLFPTDEQKNKALEYNMNLSALLPDVRKYFDYSDNKGEHKASEPIDALLITHFHEDHIGALSHLALAGFKLPKVYASYDTVETIKALLRKSMKIPYKNWPEFKVIKPYKKFKIGSMGIAGYCVSHPTPGAMGFKFKMKDAVFEDMGDNRLAASQFSEPLDFKKYQKLSKEFPTTHLYVDSTSIAVDDSHMFGKNMTLKEVEKLSQQSIDECVNEVLDILRNRPGKRFYVPLISRSMENMYVYLKAAQIFAKEQEAVGNKFKAFLDGFQMQIVYTSLQNRHSDFDDIIFNSQDIENADAKVFNKEYPSGMVFISGAFGEKSEYQMSGLARLARGMHTRFKFDDNSVLLQGQRLIDGLHPEEVRKDLQLAASQGVEVIANDFGLDPGNFERRHIQLSGHNGENGTRFMLKFIKDSRPNKDEPMVVFFGHASEGQAREAAEILDDIVDKSHPLSNGQIYKLSKKKVKLLENVNEDEMKMVAVDYNPYAGVSVYKLVDCDLNELATLKTVALESMNGKVEYISNPDQIIAKEEKHISNRNKAYAEKHKSKLKPKSDEARLAINARKAEREANRKARTAQRRAQRSIKNGGYGK